MSLFFVMLGIMIDSYGHVLGPRRVLLDTDIFFSPFFKPFFNGLNGKIQNVIKV